MAANRNNSLIFLQNSLQFGHSAPQYRKLLLISCANFLLEAFLCVDHNLAGIFVCRAYFVGLIPSHIKNMSSCRLAAHGFGESLSERSDLIGLLIHCNGLHVESIDRFARTLARLHQLLLQTLLRALLCAEIALPLGLVAGMGLEKRKRRETTSRACWS